MLKSSEVRLGNWVQETGSDGSICFIKLNFDFLECLYAEEGLFDPIPLSPEILKNSGLIILEEDTESVEWGTEDGIFVIVTEGSTHSECNQPYYFESRFRIERFEIKYVHQLQNLFFSLTGDELNIQLPKYTQA